MTEKYTIQVQRSGLWMTIREGMAASTAAICASAIRDSRIEVRILNETTGKIVKYFDFDSMVEE